MKKKVPAKRPRKVAADVLGQMDLVFVIDTTGSMGSYILEAKRFAADVAERIAKESKLDMRYGIVAYRDHPPQDNTYVTKVFDFTDADAFRVALEQLNADGGGDRAEAVWDGVNEAVKLSWRDKSDRILYLIGDSPPHLQCLCGVTADALIGALTKAGIEVNAHSIEGAPDTTAAFELLSKPTGGTTTVAQRPEHMTTTYTTSLTGHSTSVSTARSIIGVMDTAGVSYGEAAASLGMTESETVSNAAYLTRRGLMPDAKPVVETKIDSTEEK